MNDKSGNRENQKTAKSRVPSTLLRIFHSIRYEAVLRVYRLISQNRKISGTPVFLPKMLTEPESGVILSISPHPDDDVFAAAGTLHRHSIAGASIISVIVTDGARGNSDSALDSNLPDIRAEEARNAAKVLGFKELLFWRESDGSVQADSRLSDRFRDLIQRIHPEVIYLPFPVDYHYDHLNVAKALSRALPDARFSGILRCYECIIPLIPNCISDISGCVDIKRAAVNCFASQLKITNYTNTIVEGLNRMRTHSLLHGQGYAEGFFETDPEMLERLLMAYAPGK